jgi:AcrR family transcriptional regulator
MEAASTDLLGPSERERILQATAELCARRGFEEISVAQVIARAGVEEEVFESLFSDLDECLVAAVNALLGEVVSVIGSSYSPDRAEWESTLLGIKAILELMAAHPSFAYLGYIASRQMGSARVLEQTQAGPGLISAMLERLWEQSDAEVQPSLAARAALGGAEAVVRAEIVAGRVEQLPRLLPAFAYGATVPFLGQARALALARRSREMLRGTGWE